MSTQKRLIVSGSLALLLALAGCSSSEDTGSHPQPTDAGQATVSVEMPTQEAEPQPAESSEGPGPDMVMNHHSTLQMSGGGYKATVTIFQGELQRAQLGMTHGSLSLDAVCPVDPQRDAVIPYTVEVTNDTPNFRAMFGLGWSVSRNGVGNHGEFEARVQVGEAYVSDQGPMCELENAHQRASSGVVRTLESGSTAIAPGFLIMKNYYNPEHPDGDVEAARHVVIGIMQVIVNNERTLEASKPADEMRELQNGYYKYGVSFIPSEASKNCFVNKKVECPDV